MTNFNLNQNRKFILNILKCNEYHIEDKIDNPKLLIRGSDCARLFKVQQLFKQINLNTSLNHDELRNLFSNILYLSSHTNLKFKNQVKVNKLSIKVATLFIKSCSKDVVNKIINILVNHNPNEADFRTILAL